MPLSVAQSKTVTNLFLFNYLLPLGSGNAAALGITDIINNNILYTVDNINRVIIFNISGKFLFKLSPSLTEETQLDQNIPSLPNTLQTSSQIGIQIFDDENKTNQIIPEYRSINSKATLINVITNTLNTAVINWGNYSETFIIIDMKKGYSLNLLGDLINNSPFNFEAPSRNGLLEITQLF